MKTKKDLQKPAVGVYGVENKSKKLVPEKKQKSNKRAYIEELDEEPDDFFDFKEKESLEDYFDDDEEFDDEYDDEE